MSVDVDTEPEADAWPASAEPDSDADGGDEWSDRARRYLKRPDTIPFGTILVITFLWTLRFSQLVIWRQNRFGSVDFDSGIFGQAAWLSAHASQFDTVRGLPVCGHHDAVR